MKIVFKSKRVVGFLVASGLALLSCSSPVPKQEASFVIGEKVAGSVGFYTKDGKRIDGAKVGAHPHELALSRDGKMVFATDNGVLMMTQTEPGDNSVSAVDIATMTRVARIDLGQYRRPHGIEVIQDTGQVLVTTERPSALLLIDPEKKEIVRKFNTGGKAPHIVVVYPGTRWAFVANTFSDEVAAVHLDSAEIKSIPCGSKPQGLAFSPDGKTLYVANGGGQTVAIIDTEKREKVGEIPTGDGPIRIAVTRDSKYIIYALQNGNAVGFADTASLKEIKQIALTGKPVSLTLSPDGETAYSAVQDQDRVFVISVKDMKIESQFDTPPGTGPDPVIPIW